MLEQLLNIIAPDQCLICGTEGACVCQKCSENTLLLKKPACAMCNQLNTTGKTCPGCYAKSRLSGASVAYRYDGTAKDLIYAMKYQNHRGAMRYLADRLPDPKYHAGAVVSFVPSDGRSRRQRGFDQAEQLARHYAKASGMEYVALLVRVRHTKQVGQSRSNRLKNIKGNFICHRSVIGKTVILVDDVITTGATVGECAKVLKLAGAKRVWAVAVAKG